MTTTEPTTPTVTLAYAMADRGLPFLATDGQHYAYGETAEQALTELASVATTDPMAGQTTWTTHGVSDAERAAIVAAAAMIGRTYAYRVNDAFTVTAVADGRPSCVAAVVLGHYTTADGQTYGTGHHLASCWTDDLGAEVVR